MMRLAYTTIYDATTTAAGFCSYNGVGYHMGKALMRAGMELSYLGPLRQKYKWLLRTKQLIANKLLDKVYNRHREPLACRDYSRQIARKLSQMECDVVFSGLSCGSQPVAYLQTKLPIVIWTDCTLASVVGFYPEFTPRKSVWSNVQDGLRNEREAMARASMVIFSSDWARQQAIQQYGLSPETVKVAAFGANDERIAYPTEVQRNIEGRPTDVCRLLFVGMDWYRKGGDVALDIAEELRRRGIDVELTLVGSVPPAGRALPQHVRALGLITRRTEEGARQLQDLFARSNFLVLPTRADASPHVLAEANRYGVPCATSDVGGIPSIIRNGFNGQMFRSDQHAGDYANWIARQFGQPDHYHQLAWSSFKEYQSRLNWDVGGVQVSRLLGELLSPESRTIRRAA
jgi:glycosyltransferase involved in cell wall biosynthesis